MIKFIFISLQIILVLITVLFLTINEFIISFQIKDFIYSVSSSYFFIFLFLIFILIFLIQSLYFKSKFRFTKFKISQKIKAKEKGYNSFVNGMLALANKDYKKAINESKNVSKLLNNDTPLSLLLKSEVFKIDKKYTDLSNIYEEMIRHEATKNLGFRGLMEQYLRSQDYHHAFIYAEKLFNNNPYVEKIYDTLVNILIKTNNWQQLLNISERALSKKIIDKNISNINNSIAYYEIVKIKQYNDVDESIILIKKALKLRQFFPPYVKLYLELLIQNNDFNFAKKYFKKIWSENPHLDLKDIIGRLAKELKISNSDLTKYIISSSHKKYESQIILIESFISENNWSEAKKQIRGLLDTNPKKEVCLLMAKIEEGESANIEKINAWTLRAENGLQNNMWVCVFSKKAQKNWTSVSEGGYFNSLEWKRPMMIEQYINNNLLNYEN